MSRQQLVALLADLIRHKHLVIEEARAVLAAYSPSIPAIGAGIEVTDDASDLPDFAALQALDRQSQDKAWQLALLAVFLLLGQKSNKRLSDSQSRRARDLLRKRFEAQSESLAFRLTSGNLKVIAWQQSFYASLASYSRQMTAAGVGQLPNTETRAAVESRLAGQISFLERFTLQVVARRLVGRPLTTIAIAARSERYGAVGWGSYFLGQGSDAAYGWVEQWITRDDKQVCRVCGPRHGNYYLPGEGPMPGWDCLGDCRCEREPEYNPAEYVRLAGLPVSNPQRADPTVVQPVQMVVSARIIESSAVVSSAIVQAPVIESETTGPQMATFDLSQGSPLGGSSGSSSLPPNPLGRAGAPAGDPISGYLFFAPGDPDEAALQGAMAAVDSVHGDGELGIIPLTTIPTTALDWEAAYVNDDDRAVAIEVNANAQRKQLSLVHEVGHWLDHQMLGVAMGEQTNPAIVAANLRVMAAIRGTEQFQAWEDFVAGRRTIPITNPQTGVTNLFRPNPRAVRYLMEDREIWARAYAQYISSVSQSPELLEQFADFRSQPGNIRFWGDEDFAPVAEAIDGLVRTMGWRK